mgnify:CR=1 FL=1
MSTLPCGEPFWEESPCEMFLQVNVRVHEFWKCQHVLGINYLIEVLAGLLACLRTFHEGDPVSLNLGLSACAIAYFLVAYHRHELSWDFVLRIVVLALAAITPLTRGLPSAAYVDVFVVLGCVGVLISEPESWNPSSTSHTLE